MSIQTLGEAWRLGWRLTVRCIWGVDNPHSRSKRRTIECDTIAELDLKTLVWTRGDGFPIDQLEARLKCPRCGSRRVKILFSVPGSPEARSLQKRVGI
jgi:hypothetical protein